MFLRSPYCHWQVKKNFEAAGGKVFENTAGQGIEVYDNGVSLQIPDGSISGRLLLDCMGNASPVVLQVCLQPYSPPCLTCSFLKCTMVGHP